MGFVDVGYVAKPHGVRGELRVGLYNPESTVLLEAERVRVGAAAYEVAGARAVQGAVLLRLAGVSDRNQAELLRGQVVAVDRDLIPLAEGEVLLADLVGCHAVLADGSAYGTIAAIETGPQDRLVIHHGEVERLLPMVPEFVTDIDLDAGCVVVSPPEGLPETPLRAPRQNP